MAQFTDATEARTKKIKASIANIGPAQAEIDQNIAKFGVLKGRVHFYDKDGKKLGDMSSDNTQEIPAGAALVIANGNFNANGVLGKPYTNDNGENVDYSIKVLVKGNAAVTIINKDTTIVAEGNVTIKEKPGYFLKHIAVEPKVSVIAGGTYTTPYLVNGEVSTKGGVTAAGSTKDAEINTGGDVIFIRDLLGTVRDAISDSLSKTSGKITAGGSVFSQSALHANVTAGVSIQVRSLGDKSQIDTPLLRLRDGDRFKKDDPQLNLRDSTNSPNGFPLDKIEYIPPKEFDSFVPKPIPVLATETNKASAPAIQSDILEQMKKLCERYEGCNEVDGHNSKSFQLPTPVKPTQTKSRE